MEAETGTGCPLVRPLVRWRTTLAGTLKGATGRGDDHRSDRGNPPRSPARSNFGEIAHYLEKWSSFRISCVTLACAGCGSR